MPLADEPQRTSRASDSHACGTAPDGDALVVLRAAHTARGVAIDATTPFPRWDGAPLDAHFAVQALLGAAGGGATHGA